MYNKTQFESLITRVLTNNFPESMQKTINIATKLLLGTAAQESVFGTYLRQLGNGPALGAFQVEKITFNDLKQRFSKKFPCIEPLNFEQLEWDLRASIIVCRIKYYSCPGFPTDSLESIARYWKKYYNTYLGAGTEQEFITNYNKYIGQYKYD